MDKGESTLAENESRLTKLDMLLARPPRYCVREHGDVNAVSDWIANIKNQLKPQELYCPSPDLGFTDFEEYFKHQLTVMMNRPPDSSAPETIILWLSRVDVLVHLYKGFLDSKVKLD